jgi:L-alanine-DL-glutamate epimerase-like enolase superfamily enzyme
VGVDEELAMVREIRAAIGDRPLRLDCNGGWLVATARELIPRFDAFGIDAWEEPVEGLEDLLAIRDVTDRPLSTHVMDLPLAKALGVPDVIVTNLNELGGVRRTVEFVEACRVAGIGFRFHSGETGVASTAYLHVTANSRTAGSVFKVQHSSDNTTFADLITFATVATTLTGAEKIEVTGTVNRYVRASFAPGGSTGSITYSLAFARR